MVIHADPNLARFADYAGLNYDLLAGADGHAIENASAGFDGRIEAIRIREYGRFGNVFYQTLHAVLLARLLGCHTVYASPLTMPQRAASLDVDGLRIVLRIETDMDRVVVPTLAGHFFLVTPFGSALRALPPAIVCQTIRRFLLPLFDDFLGTVAPVGAGTLVMSFRSGDIFTGEFIHPSYVQPPASYYRRAIAFARAHLGVTDAKLVFEDEGNPTIARVQADLREGGIPFTIQSAGMLEDLACLVGASHLVAPYSTFAEAAAMLSRHLTTYFGFRNFEALQPVHRRQRPLFLGVLRQNNVRAVLIDDAVGGYIPARSWDRSSAQLRLMVEFPMEHLRVLEGDSAEAWEIGIPDPATRHDMLSSLQEADDLRALLLANREEVRAASARQLAVEQEVHALVDRLEASQREGAEAHSLLLQTQNQLRNLDATIRASRSWRLTAPLRRMARFLRSTA